MPFSWQHHRFGHDRIDCEALAAPGRLKVVKVEPCSVGGMNVSSTKIRRLLEEGKTAEAELLLGPRPGKPVSEAMDRSDAAGPNPYPGKLKTKK